MTLPTKSELFCIYIPIVPVKIESNLMDMFNMLDPGPSHMTLRRYPIQASYAVLKSRFPSDSYIRYAVRFGQEGKYAIHPKYVYIHTLS